MSDNYTLKVTTDFSSAHTLRDYPGACSRMHGHNWKVEVEAEAIALDELGMAIDFKRIRQLTRDATDKLDHRYLNDISPFDEINPTAENLARYLYREIAKTLDDERVRVCAITLWETDHACVKYSDRQP